MRVTNKMLSSNFLRDMNVNLENMKTLQQQLTSGKEIRRPSDDPFKTAKAMQLHTDIDANKQYKENISDTTNWLDVTDTAVGQVGDVLQRVRELLVSAGNASYGSSERTAIKDEINEKVGEISQILNTSFDGKYVFGGTRGTTRPLTTEDSNGNTVLNYNNATKPDVEYNKIAAKMSVEVSQGVTMEYNVSAIDITEFDGKDLSSILKKIVYHLDGKDENNADYENATSDLTNSDLANITDAINNLLKIRSEVGAKQNRMESAQQRNEDENYNMTEILSSTEDIDITEKTMEYATMQTVYMASLQTSAKVIQPTLMDYLG